MTWVRVKFSLFHIKRNLNSQIHFRSFVLSPYTYTSKRKSECIKITLFPAIVSMTIRPRTLNLYEYNLQIRCSIQLSVLFSDYSYVKFAERRVSRKSRHGREICNSWSIRTFFIHEYFHILSCTASKFSLLDIKPDTHTDFSGDLRIVSQATK